MQQLTGRRSTFFVAGQKYFMASAVASHTCTEGCWGGVGIRYNFEQKKLSYIFELAVIQN